MHVGGFVQMLKYSNILKQTPSNCHVHHEPGMDVKSGTQGVVFIYSCKTNKTHEQKQNREDTRLLH